MHRPNQRCLEGNSGENSILCRGQEWGFLTFNYIEIVKSSVSDPDPGCKISAKTWKMSIKINQNQMNFVHIFQEKKYFLFNGLIIYPINNKINQFLEKYIFDEKRKKEKKLVFFFILGRIWSRIQIRIKMKRI